MKEKLTNNGALKLISVCLAIALWLLVINSEDPMENKTVYVTNITYLHENVVTSSGKTYSVDDLEEKGIPVTVQVRTSDYKKVKADDFEVQIDLANIGPYGAVEVEVKWLGSMDYTINESDMTWRTKTVTVTLEDIKDASYIVKLRTTGQPAGEYIVGDERTVTPRTVNIKAPKSVLEQIHSVGIEVDVTDAYSDLTGQAPIILYDVEGMELNLDYSSFEDYEFAISETEIQYFVPILKTKEVLLSFAGTTGTVAEGYRYTGLQGANQTVHIAGLKAVLADVAEIEIPAEELNLDGARENVEVQIDVSKYVPEGVTVESENIVTVVLVVEPLIRQTIELTADQIRMEDGQNGWNYKIQDTVKVVVEGLEEDLDTLTIESLEAWISLKGMKEGTNTAQVNVTVNNAFTLISVGDAVVVMEEVVPETESSEETTAPDETTAGETEESEEETSKETNESAGSGNAGSAGDSGGSDSTEEMTAESTER